jgi:hypothetical protein
MNYATEHLVYIKNYEFVPYKIKYLYCSRRLRNIR